MATETSKTTKKKKKVAKKRKKTTKKATASADKADDSADASVEAASDSATAVGVIDEADAPEAEVAEAPKAKTRAKKTPARKKTTKKKKATKAKKKKVTKAASTEAEDEASEIETVDEPVFKDKEAVLIPFPVPEDAAGDDADSVDGDSEIGWPLAGWPDESEAKVAEAIVLPTTADESTDDAEEVASVEAPKEEDDGRLWTGRKKRPKKKKRPERKPVNIDDYDDDDQEDSQDAALGSADDDDDGDDSFGVPGSLLSSRVGDAEDATVTRDREDETEDDPDDVDGNVAEPAKPEKSRSRRGSRGRRRRGERRGRSGQDAEEAVVADEVAVDDETGVDVTGVDEPDEEAAVEEKPRAEKDGRSSRRGGRNDRGGRRSRGRSRRDEITTDPEDIIEVDGGGHDAAPTKADRTMLINAAAGDECRIAVVGNGRLEELFIERASSQSHVGNIYKGRVTNVEPSIQAAFVDFGLTKNGFLHISDVQPQYFPNYNGEPEEVGRKIPRRNRPPIQECFQRGQEVIVQVIKEGVGTKGPTLTTYLSIPGRFLVMMPGMNRHGVSRKIDDEDARREMKGVLSEMTFPPGIGFILRTAGMGQNKRELQRDLNYLTRLWKTVISRVKKMNAPAELYQESDLVTRTIRDVFTADFRRVVVDDAEAARRANEFLRIAMPRAKIALELYSDREPLFHRFGIEHEIDNISKREVPLPSGGSLVIESTEALVAIDVNSGKFRTPEDAEEMAHNLNMEAAEEIARQLRLRDLGGLIICDFIDMRLDRHKREVERALRDALKSHKERARILRMSAFGLIELTRQRRGPGMKRNTYFECRHCNGSGLLKMPETVVLDVMRNVQLASHHERVACIMVTASDGVAYQILNRKRAALATLEEETGKEIIVRGDANFTDDQVEYHCEDSRGQTVVLNTRGS